MNMQVETSDSVEFLKKIDDYGLDIIYCDPPYALGSEIIIRADGKVDYSKAVILWTNGVCLMAIIGRAGSRKRLDHLNMAAE